MPPASLHLCCACFRIAFWVAAATCTSVPFLGLICSPYPISSQFHPTPSNSIPSLLYPLLRAQAYVLWQAPLLCWCGQEYPSLPASMSTPWTATKHIIALLRRLRWQNGRFTSTGLESDWTASFPKETTDETCKSLFEFSAITEEPHVKATRSGCGFLVYSARFQPSG